MVHLRVVSPSQKSQRVLDLLLADDAVTNIVYLEGAARQPEGDVILCDVAREDASIVLGDLKDLGIDHDGSIAMEAVDVEISDAGDRAEHAAEGMPGDAVIWEQVASRTTDNTELNWNFITLIVMAGLIAACGIILDSTILIIGAMVVGPEFGPIAGFCVALISKRKDVAIRSAKALLVGFPAAITAAFLFALFTNLINIGPADPTHGSHPFTQFISQPNEFSLIIAIFAGVAGILSLTSSKSGALVGVLISVTTIPSAANIGVAAAYADWGEWRGAMAQLALNLIGIVAAGTVTLLVQRAIFRRRQARHMAGPSRSAAGLSTERRSGTRGPNDL